jgi:hypothetical protein
MLAYTFLQFDEFCALIKKGKAMAEVVSYHILTYGGPDGYQGHRAQIALYGTAGTTLAYVRFIDPGTVFEPDTETAGVIKMHLPSAMFPSVVDLLRNEKPIHIYFAQWRGFLGTQTAEPVGEGE